MKVLNIFDCPKKSPPTRFSTVTPTNVWIRPQNFLTFSFNHLFYNTCVKFEGNTQCQFQIIELEPRAPSKKNWFFW